VTTYFANKLAGVDIALNSRLLPAGSLKNIVCVVERDGKGGARSAARRHERAVRPLFC
jgi:hypothetical protein